MSFSDWTRTGQIPTAAATPATLATDKRGSGANVATVATVAGTQENVQARRPATATEAAELRMLVRMVGEFYGFSADEHREALEVALADPVAALDCFRAVAKERGLNCSKVVSESGTGKDK